MTESAFLAGGVAPMQLIPVSEVFGPVWQGEGPSAGLRASFLRLDNCNLHCSWCDTPYTWAPDRPAATMMSAYQVLATVAEHGTDLLVLTGGEPVMHRGNDQLMALLRDWPGKVEVETNGTLIPSDRMASLVHSWIVSPKIAQDDDPESKRIKPDVLRWFAAEGAALKVVCRDVADVENLADAAWAWGDWRGKVWVMPEGTDAQRVIECAQTVAPAVERHGFHLTLRQQVLLYGDERAR